MPQVASPDDAFHAATAAGVLTCSHRCCALDLGQGRGTRRRLARHRPPPPPQPSDPDFRPLDDVIGAAMVRYGVPGVAVGAPRRAEYTNGHGG